MNDPLGEQYRGVPVEKRHTSGERALEEVPTRIRPALTVLYEAFQYADQTSGDEWEFAVEINQLAALGLTRNNFRWLVRRGLVEHQREVTLEGDDGRAFRPTGDLTFPEATGSIEMDLSKMAGGQRAVAVDAKKPYRELRLGRLAAEKQTWTAPYRSDWAIAVGEFK